MEKNNTYIVLGIIEKERKTVLEDIAQTVINLNECTNDATREELHEHLIIRVNYSKRLTECIVELKKLLRKGE